MRPSYGVDLKRPAITFAFLITAFLLPAPSGAYEFEEPEAKKTFRVFTTRMEGYTKYYISFESIMLQTEFFGESELEFPLGTFMAGFDLGMRGRFENQKTWGLSVRYQTNVIDPSSAMKDSDWITWYFPEGHSDRTKWSYTESDAGMRAHIVEVESRLGMDLGEKLLLEGIVGLKYQRLSFEMKGIEGWQGFGDVPVVLDTLHGVNVLDYRVSYVMPYAGISTRYSWTETVSAAAELLASPRTTYSDWDDHILRYRTFEGSGVGHAIIGVLGLRWEPKSDWKQKRWFAQADVGVTRLSASGSQTQRVYRDDPNTPEDETQMITTGIHHEVESMQYVFSIYFGLRL